MSHFKRYFRRFLQFLLGTILTLISLTNIAICQTVTISLDEGELFGTLLESENNIRCMTALIIAGSGPVDRNGNSPYMTNNALKYLAQELFKINITTLRFDKRGVGESLKVDESEIRFQHYVDDAVRWASYLKDKYETCKSIIIGHSQGSLIGILAAKKSKVDFFISLSGPGLTADKIILSQLSARHPFVVKEIDEILHSLRNGENTQDIPNELNPIFRPSVQNFLISWMKHNPQEEISTLTIPVLVIHGGRDYQLGLEHAALLSKANSLSQKVIIESMNHVLKESSDNTALDYLTYLDPKQMIHPEIVVQIQNFLEEHSQIDEP